MTTARALAVLSFASLLVVFATGCDDSTPASPSPLAEPTIAADVANSGGTILGVANGAVFMGLDEAGDVARPDAEDAPTLKAHPPTPLAPVDDVVVRTLQPTLVVGNAEGLFVAASFTYRFELYDGMNRIVEGVGEPRDAGSATFMVSVELKPDTAYRWRARAELDGAHGPWADAAFRTLAVRIDPPIPNAPANGARNIRKPIILEVINGATHGPVGTVTMTFEIATDSAFGSIIDTIRQRAGRHDFTGTDKKPGTDPERARRTSVQPSVELRPGTIYYWRVIARDDKGHASEYSRTRRFTTASVTPTTTPPTGSGADEIDVSDVTWLHHDVSGWPAASRITSVRIRDVPAGGICIEHTKSRSWPSVSISGTSLAGNPWVFANINGRWYAGTYEWNRPGQTCKLTVAGKHKSPSEELGPHIKRPPMTSWVPKSGERVGFMVSTPARFGPDGPVRERSNIVVVTWP